MSKLSLYFRTIKYLKPTQIYHRVLKRFQHPKIHTFIGNISPVLGCWQVQELYPQKLYSNGAVEFLNHRGLVTIPEDWNNVLEEKLWLYNLHYFDDLISFGSQTRKKLQYHWVNKWIDENEANAGGNGWEAYTLSLRIVNWTKAFLSGFAINDKFVNSLAQQADFLSQNLEKHLLGNHYFVNLKALLFAGCYLQGSDADKWLSIGLKDYERELNEQVLNDGGSFELTPMYHAIMLTDLLDLANLFKAYPTKVPANTVELTHQTITKMLTWLDIMSHGDDKVGFFNDCAFGIAPDNYTIREYAQNIGFTVHDVKGVNIAEGKLSIYNLQNTGYVSVISTNFKLIADLSPVGASYIPAHAHADTLSFEMSLGNQRIFVNSGTSEYGTDNERLRQRGTSAHNTVVINDVNSSEVWSGFRVARRAKIIDRVIGAITPDQTVQFSAAHNGYKKQGINCIHHRTWKVALDLCEINDVLQGSYTSAIGYLHLHPSVEVINYSDERIKLSIEKYIINLKVSGAKVSIEKTTWHPEFGRVLKNKKLCFQFESNTMHIGIFWNKHLN